MKWKVASGGVTAPKGFTASGMYAGIKKSFRKFDVALIHSAVPAVAAALFTTNRVKAWPLYHDLRVVKQPCHRTIFANSGNANCFNGASGARAVSVSLDLVSRGLKVPKSQIFLASTGIIGRAFPIKKIKSAIPHLIEALSPAGGRDAARGILTTDSHPKEIALRFSVDRKPVTVAATAKGAGMVFPEMNARGERRMRHATMLCFVTTDLNISKSMFQKAVASASETTFNQLVIDNDLSTNDMVLGLANGAAENKRIVSDGRGFRLLQSALTFMFTSLAKDMARDGEGVAHVCEIALQGARTLQEANGACRRIASSMLFKTMLAGCDPNWGRLVASIGASNVRFSPKLNISFDGIPILRNGRELRRNKARVSRVLRRKEFRLEIDLKSGRFQTRFWATDLTKFYVWINSAYST